MNPLIQPKNASRLILIALLLACLPLSPRARAVVPAPDGGYPGGNTAEGQSALFSLTSGGFNTAVGWLSLRALNTGQFNTGVGAGTLALNTADQNTATGAGALLSNTTGPQNTANGAFALLSNSTGSFNTAVGHIALENCTSGNGNVAIGDGAGIGVTTANSVICIGSAGQNVSDTTWIRNVYGTTTISGTTAPVIVSDLGQLGTVASSERFKKDIATMDKTSEVILSLRPVTFHYKSDTRETPQFGLIAEEVAKVNPALVLPDKEGKPYSVRYDQVNAMLLNEFLKEHRKIEQLEKQVAALTAGLQKVSAQVEMNRTAPRTVVDKE
jgi:Chaperone of endosialidase